MSDRKESYYLNGGIAEVDRSCLTPEIAGRLEDGNRKQADCVLADLEQAALIKRRIDLSGAQNLRRLLDFGIDISILGQHGDIGRQSIEEINSQIIEIEDRRDSVLQSRDYLHLHLRIEN